MVMRRHGRRAYEESTLTSTQQPVIPESHKGLLDTTALAFVATIGPKGEPQVNPVWFDWDGQHIKFSQTTTRQKYHNLQRDPHVAISLVDPENPYRYLEVRGRMVDVEPDPDRAFINKMAKKYLGKDEYPWHRPGDERIVIVVEPESSTHMG
jgi:PPOX class probable F420-dependent enzyme